MAGYHNICFLIRSPKMFEAPFYLVTKSFSSLDDSQTKIIRKQQYPRIEIRSRWIAEIDIGVRQVTQSILDGGVTVNDVPAGDHTCVCGDADRDQ